MRVLPSSRHSPPQAPRVAVTETPPPQAYFRVEGGRLWVRVVIVQHGRRQLSERQVVGIWVSVFGTAALTIESPLDGGAWDSIYLVGPCPSPDDWPPPKRFDVQ